MKTTTLYLLLFLSLFFTNNNTAQTKQFTASEVLEDLRFLKSELLVHHHNIFVYSSQSEFDLFFEETEKKISTKMTEQEVYCLLTPVLDLVQDGHTLFSPSKERINSAYEQNGFFPFQIYWDGKDLKTVMNLSEEKDIIDGTKVVSINGLTSNELMDFLFDRMMSDGGNQNYPIWVLNNFFSTYYSYYFGNPKVFEMEFEDENGKVFSKKLTAIKQKIITKNRGVRYPNFEPVYKMKKNGGIVLEIFKEKKTARLIIKSFENAILKNYYQQKFAKTIDSFFKQIEAAKIEHLILDLRNNQGGNIKYGRILLSYLLKEDFQIIKEYAKVDKTKCENEDQRLKSCKGPQLGTHQPMKNAFKGKLIVLINGGSFSNSGIVCSVLKKYNRASFIGETTGGSEYILAGSGGISTLPNTKMTVEIPRLQFFIKDHHKFLHGLMPDIELAPTAQDIIEEKDVVKLKALELIGN